MHEKDNTMLMMTLGRFYHFIVLNQYLPNLFLSQVSTQTLITSTNFSQEFQFEET